MNAPDSGVRVLGPEYLSIADGFLGFWVRVVWGCQGFRGGAGCRPDRVTRITKGTPGVRDAGFPDRSSGVEAQIVGVGVRAVRVCHGLHGFRAFPVYQETISIHEDHSELSSKTGLVGSPTAHDGVPRVASWSPMGSRVCRDAGRWVEGRPVGEPHPALATAIPRRGGASPFVSCAILLPASTNSCRR